MHKLCNGKVPPLHNELLDEADHNLIAEIKKTKETISGLLENYKFRDALFEVIDLSRKGNKYLQDKEPWKKGDDQVYDSAYNGVLSGGNQPVSPPKKYDEQNIENNPQLSINDISAQQVFNMPANNNTDVYGTY
jgi:hypothetical protein